MNIPLKVRRIQRFGTVVDCGGEQVINPARFCQCVHLITMPVIDMISSRALGCRTETES